MDNGVIVAVSRSQTHTMSKPNRDSITLLEGLGIEGDAHMGKTIKHRSRVAKYPTLPNLRQVHLIHIELMDELIQSGFNVLPGQMGENITTKNIDLLGLPTGTLLHLGEEAVIEITGLRNPCKQLDGVHPGLMAAVLGRDENNNLIRKSGIMAIVVKGGMTKPGDIIRVELPEKPHHPLQPV